MTHTTESWEEFEKTNPRATLMEGYLYFRGDDIRTFLASQRSSLKEKIGGCCEIPMKK
jgi:hypothetical protein